MLKRIIVLAAASGAVAAVGLGAPQPAEACGGFFCGNQPVDQQAERILFAMNDDGTTTMVVQIAYQGKAADFAWVLPLGSVPEADSLDTFPQAALTALDANTGPVFQYPEDPDCYGWFDAAAEGDGGGGPPTDRGGVEVHIRETVGPYDVAVVESRDPAALVSWLRDNDFRVTTPMEPYIRIYTEEGMKFLALKLNPGEDVSDIAPFKMTLPGQTPTIPLRLTALAAEPEMGIAVFILGDMRFGPANWPDVEVDDSEIIWRAYTWPLETNWAALVARGVDEAGGQGFVTEFAGSTEPYLETLRSTTPRDEEQEEALNALLGIMDGHAYLSRLYTRLSAEEMTSDPTFRRTSDGDVERFHTLPRWVMGRDMCEIDWDTGMSDATSPCDFAACGAGGLCRIAEDGGELVAGCACAPGSTARTTFDPAGRPTVTCQDMRMSFLNPGDREIPGAEPLPDVCVGYDCGAGGTCVPMNMTPTCQCHRGLIATGTIAEDGTRITRCVEPTSPVPPGFYNTRLPALPVELPGGRDVVVPPPEEMTVGGGGACSAAGDGAAPVAPLFALIGLVGLAARRRRR